MSSILELTDTRPELKVLDSEYQRLLGYPEHRRLEGRARELANWARDWYQENGRPWLYARQSNGLDLTGGTIGFGGSEFASKHFHEQLTAAQAHDAVLVAVSAGIECEDKARQLWQEGKPDEYFFLEMFGSAVVEQLVATTAGRLCAWADGLGLGVLPHYSPGYSGWEMSEQIKLWHLIQNDGARALPGPLQVLDTGMLRPKKSLLAVYGITRHVDRVRQQDTLVPCHNCCLSGCQYRRAPYQRFLPQMEDVSRLHPSTRDTAEAVDQAMPVLEPRARYSVNQRALNKWSNERLKLQTRDDGSIVAHFRYEGTTCSNLGHPLEFHYQVHLGPRMTGYQITDSTCAPAPGDAGHAHQCEYLNNAATLMGCIAEEKPLLGKPLNEVLTWQRPYNPSGCYCDRDRREHKWGLVFEVIHYALVQREAALRQTGPTPTNLY